MVRYRRLRRVAVLSRCLPESLAVLALLTWSSDRLPAALAHCVGLLHRLPAVILHPLSAFVLGNAIVVALLAKSGNPHSADDPPPSCRATTAASRPATFDVDDNLSYYFYSSSSPPPPPLQRKGEEEEEDVLYEHKAVLVVNTTVTASHPRKGGPEAEPEVVRSEDLAGAVTNKFTEQKLLCKSETELGAQRNVAAMSEEGERAGEEGGAGVVVDDSVEFRQKIEAFISKQLRFIEMEEEELLFAEVPRCGERGS